MTNLFEKTLQSLTAGLLSYIWPPLPLQAQEAVRAAELPLLREVTILSPGRGATGDNKFS